MNRTTSRISYKDLIETGRENTQVKSILKLLSTGESLSRREIADVVRLEVSAVAGRVNSLIKMGIIKEDKMRKCLLSKRMVKPVSIIGVYNGK